YNSAYIVNNYHEPDPVIRQRLLDIFSAANSDPRMREMFRDLWLPGFKAAGGEISAAYTLSGVTSELGDWGILHGADDLDTQRYEGIREFAWSTPRWWGSVLAGRRNLVLRQRSGDRRGDAAHELGPGPGVPAVAFLRPAVGELGVGGGIGRGLEELLEAVHGEVQVEVVHVAGEEVQLAGEPGP